VADQAHKNSHADCNCERDKRAMLDFLGKAAQGIVAKLRRLAADFRRFVAHRIGAPAAIRTDREAERGPWMVSLTTRPAEGGGGCDAHHCLRALSTASSI
jgi:hypothetical protein